MGTSWKAVADDNRRQMLLLLKDGEKTPTEMAKSFEFTLPAVSTHLRVLKDAGLVSERKVGQNRFYSVNKEKMSEMIEFFDIFWDDKLARLKETRGKQEGSKRKMTEGEIRKTVVVDAAPEVVFKALTDEKELVRWMPQEARMDPRLGGEYEFKYHWAQKGLHSVATGKIIDLIPNKRLSYTYVLTRFGSGNSGGNSLMDHEVADSVVTWILDALPDGKTHVTVVHSGIAKEAYGAFDGAWGYYMTQLMSHCGTMAGADK